MEPDTADGRVTEPSTRRRKAQAACPRVAKRQKHEPRVQCTRPTGQTVATQQASEPPTKATSGIVYTIGAERRRQTHDAVRRGCLVRLLVRARSSGRRERGARRRGSALVERRTVRRRVPHRGACKRKGPRLRPAYGGDGTSVQEELRGHDALGTTAQALERLVCCHMRDTIRVRHLECHKKLAALLEEREPPCVPDGMLGFV
jgi:hypothetical protein